ncbi:MAG: cobalt-precorrin-6A reductase [Microcystaceae cyanobacterium]
MGSRESGVGNRELENFSLSSLSPRIWLIGGTSESARIAQAIAAEKIPWTITVTTPTAQSLYPQSPDLRVQVGQLDDLQLETFLTQESIVAVVDASHPYAVVISQIAIAVAADKQIPYLRYERPNLERTEDGIKSEGQITNSKFRILLESFETLLKGDYLLGQRVLLTIGYKTLPLFQSWQDRATLFARLLPTVHSIEVATAAGFTPDRLIALRPPINAELEKALWCQWQISLVITKASGQAGGEEIKQSVANELNIPLIVIARPNIAYPRQTSNLSEILSFCRQSIASESCLTP